MPGPRIVRALVLLIAEDGAARAYDFNADDVLDDHGQVIPGGDLEAEHTFVAGSEMTVDRWLGNRWVPMPANGRHSVTVTTHGGGYVLTVGSLEDLLRPRRKASTNPALPAPAAVTDTPGA